MRWTRQTRSLHRASRSRPPPSRGLDAVAERLRPSCSWPGRRAALHREDPCRRGIYGRSRAVRCSEYPAGMTDPADLRVVGTALASTDRHHGWKVEASLLHEAVIMVLYVSVALG